MSVLIDSQGVIADNWTGAKGCISPVTPGAYYLLAVEDFVASRAAWDNHQNLLGVTLAANDNPASLASHLGRLSLVSISFSAFTDGRGYTQARLLRERLRFGGILRATGQVGADQVVLLTRCGFNEFELPDSQTAATALRLLSLQTPVYQRAVTNENLVSLPGPSRQDSLEEALSQ